MDAVHETERHFRSTMRAARGTHKMSQRELCEKLEAAGIALDTSAITRLENGQRVIRLGEALQIAAILGFTVQPSPDDGTALAAERIRHMSDQLLELADTL